MPRKVIAVVDDLFFASKIRATAESLDLDLRFARSLDSLAEIIASHQPDLMLVDLHNKKVDAISVAKLVRKEAHASTVPLLAFFSHVEVELQRAALAAGYDRVIPRSVFSRDLAGIL